MYNMEYRSLPCYDAFEYAQDCKDFQKRLLIILITWYTFSGWYIQVVPWVPEVITHHLVRWSFMNSSCEEKHTNMYIITKDQHYNE